MESMVSETTLDWGLAPQCSHPPLQFPPPLIRSFPRCFLPAQWMVTSDCKSLWAQRVHKGPCLFLLSVPLHIWWGWWVRFPSSQQFNSTHVESLREGIISKKTNPQCPGWYSVALGRLPYAILLEVRVGDGSTESQRDTTEWERERELLWPTYLAIVNKICKERWRKWALKYSDTVWF